MIPAPLPETAYAAVVALDLANRQNSCALSPSAASRPQTGWLDNAPMAIDHWDSGLGRSYPGGSIAVVLVIQKHTAVLPDWLGR